MKQNGHKRSQENETKSYKEKRADWVRIDCCTFSFSSASPEAAVRAYAKHLELRHGIPREASAGLLKADADARDFESPHKDNE